MQIKQAACANSIMQECGCRKNVVTRCTLICVQCRQDARCSAAAVGVKGLTAVLRVQQGDAEPGVQGDEGPTPTN